MNTLEEGNYTHMSQEAASHPEGFVNAALQLVQEVMVMEIVQLLQVPKDVPPLASEVLRDVAPLQLGEIVLTDITQGLYVLPLCGQQLFHDPLQLPVSQTQDFVRVETQKQVSSG